MTKPKVSSLAVALATWATLLLLFAVTRWILGVTFFAKDLSGTTDFVELLRVLWLSERLDVSMATLLVLPLIIVVFVQNLLPAKWQVRVPSFSPYAYVALFAAVFACVSTHFFFYHYQDRFNTFFWEFWENRENARLVVFSLPDELPLIWVGFYLVAATVSSFAFFRWLTPRLARNIRMPVSMTRRITTALAILVLTFACARGTFEILPLTKQHLRGQVAVEHHLNMLHGNPFFDLYLSHEEVPNFAGVGRSELANYRVSVESAQAAFNELAPSWHRHSAYVSDKGYIEPRYLAPGLLGKVLKAKPKHIVLIVMESFTEWVLDTDDGDFDAHVAPKFRSLRTKGHFFTNYYQAGSGTIDNVTKSAYQIPTPLGFPEATSFSASHKKFPSSLPEILKNEGYETHFYYGGSLSWHNIGYVFTNLGFSGVYGENRLHDVEKTRFGLFDGDLLSMVADDLEKATVPTFSLVMTLSNHPPFRMPDGFKTAGEIAMPQSLQSNLIDEGNFLPRYTSYAYADDAIGKFVERLSGQPVDNETLYIFTSDHSHDGTFRFDVKDSLRMGKIPLLFYAPKLFVENVGTHARRATHMDLGATLVSLLSTEDREVASFGQSLFADLEDESQPLMTADENCVGAFCVLQFQPYRIGTDLRLEPCAAVDVECHEAGRAITARRRAYDQLGLHYLFNFEGTASR